MIHRSTKKNNPLTFVVNKKKKRKKKRLVEVQCKYIYNNKSRTCGTDGTALRFALPEMML